MKFCRRCLIVAGCAVLSWTLPVSAQTNAVRLGKHLAHPTQYLARFKADSPSTARLAAMQAGGLAVRAEVGLVPGLVVLEDAPSIRVQQAAPTTPRKVGVTGKDLLGRIEQLQSTGLFEYVEPDYYVTALRVPNDTAFTGGTLWGLTNNGTLGGVAGADINATAAWDLTTGSASVIVAVIDTGIRYTHTDLAAQMWPGNGTNAITGTTDPMDDNGHGTHVSGTIGAAANNGHPHVGVAWNVRLMGCKFLDSQGSGTTSDAIKCIEFAVANGAKILNNSWGGGGFSQALYDAIAAARTQGVLFVAAAGNESNNNDLNPSYPASYDLDNIVSVAAVTRADGLASFSNIGARSVHLGAPGLDIYSCWNTSDTAYNTISGTSMATPHVSGVAALIRALYPAASVSEVRQRLLAGAVPIAALAGKTTTGGRLNAFNSLSAGPDGKLEISLTTASGNTLFAGSPTTVFVRVTDFLDVTDATVTGSNTVTGAILTFRNDGLGGDAVANDAIYSAPLDVPSSASTISLKVHVTAPGKTPADASAPFAVVTPPSNDFFAGRTPITPVPATVLGNNDLATAEPNEPNPMGVAGGKSVWWTWTAPVSGLYTVNTEGSGFDTVLGVYQGTAVGSLTAVGENDDTGTSYTSEVVFQATANSAYQILVDGYAGSSGKIQLNVSAVPPITNDAFANRKPIPGIDITVTGANFSATAQPNEPSNAGVTPFRTVWWTWTSPISGLVTISTGGSTFDTTLGVYTGTVLSSLIPVASNDDVGGGLLTSEVTFGATQGTAYQIVVDAFDVPGNIVLSIARQPVNDNFSARIPLTGAFVETSGYSLGATNQTGESLFDSRPRARTVWWTWTSPTSGNATITTIGSTFDTVLAVCTGATVNSLTLVGYNDDYLYPTLLHSQVTFAAQAGTAYHIQVSGYYYPPDFLHGAPEALAAGKVALTITLDGASRLSVPFAVPSGSLGTLSSDPVELELTGETERPYVLSASTDLNTWTPVGTNTLIGKRFVFTDPGGNLSSGKRFYRAQPATLIGSPPRAP